MLKIGKRWLIAAAVIAALPVSGCRCGTGWKCCSSRAAVGIERIRDAAGVLNGVAKVTDLAEAPALSSGGGKVYLKLETQQPIGAFKLRGAYYMMSKLTPEQAARGVVTCSAGNHAQGVGFAADHFGIRAAVFLPKSAPEKKINAVRSYKNAEVFLVDGSFDDAGRAALEYQKAKGAVYVPPFDDADVIAGQGTVGLEILEQLPDADAVIVPVGGGGLIAGVASAVKALKPSCLVIGVQSEQSNAMEQSLDKGEVVTLSSVNTLADGTAVKRPGDLTFAVCRECVDEMISVSEEQVAEAIRVLHNRCGVTAEGAGALPVAAVLSGKVALDGKKTVCVISGGNIDPGVLQSVLAGGK